MQSETVINWRSVGIEAEVKTEAKDYNKYTKGAYRL